MIKQILKQIWIQRSSNAWIYAELLLVFLLLWYIVDYGFMMVHNRCLPRGFSIENTYRIKYKDIVTDEDRYDLENLKMKIENFKGVEGVLVAGKHDGTTPFSGSYQGNVLYTDTTEKATSIPGQFKSITSPKYFEIFDVRSVKYPGKLGRLDFSNRSSIALSERMAKKIFGDEDPIGKSLFYKSGMELVVNDVVADQKRFDFTTYQNFFLVLGNENNITSPEIAFKVNNQFDLEEFRQKVSPKVGSYKMDKFSLEMTDGTRMNIHLRLFVMLFFVLSTSVGVFGTYWFRNQARRGEIGLRMSMGSSRREILKHFVSEALLLLTLAAIPAMIIVAIILKLDIIEVVGLNNKQGLYLTENIWLRGAITVAITYLFMALVVALSAWIPAYRASKLNPVDALSEE